MVSKVDRGLHEGFLKVNTRWKVAGMCMLRGCNLSPFYSVGRCREEKKVSLPQSFDVNAGKELRNQIREGRRRGGIGRKEEEE